MRALGLATLAALAGCYSGSSAASDVNAAWRGRARIDLEGRLGSPTLSAPQPDGTTALRWIAHGVNIKELPSASLDLKVTNASFSFNAEAKPGVVEKYDYILANALVAPGGSVLLLDSISLAAGIPEGANIRTGVIMGLSAALGMFSNASTPIPSTNLYIGGMIGPRLALLGSYSFVNAKDSDLGYAMGHAWGFGVQYWPAARLAVRAEAAGVLDLEPGLKDATFAPGAIGALSYALVRSGSFVLDARFDLTVSTSAAFGMAGLGVNIN